ncbi:MAG TPA: hypothetical protein VJ783_11490 [Pirellulales bacterium]|nr:hypothetical protein [Pirellulales bacterium]
MSLKYLLASLKRPKKSTEPKASPKPPAARPGGKPRQAAVHASG